MNGSNPKSRSNSKSNIRDVVGDDDDDDDDGKKKNPSYFLSNNFNYNNREIISIEMSS